VPSQRVSEYVRLVSALRHNTPPDHADIAHLDQALRPLYKLHQFLDEVSVTPRLSMGPVDPRLGSGRVGSGWVDVLTRFSRFR